MLDEYRTWLGYSSRKSVGPPDLPPERVQMMLFSGNGTGTVKAVMIVYRQTLANAQGTAVGWGPGPEDFAIQATPCFHAGFNVLSTSLLTLGGRVVVFVKQLPHTATAGETSLSTFRRPLGGRGDVTGALQAGIRCWRRARR